MAGNYQRAIYDKWLGLRDPVRDQKLTEEILQLTGNQKQRILEVGCGDGHLLERFVEANECYGVDISKASLASARKKGITVYCIDLETDELPFSTDFFDIVVCSEVMEHILDTDNLFRELNRVLKTGRYLILTFPNINQPVSWLAQIALDLPPMYSARYKSPHVRDFTIKVVRNILDLFGFKIVRVQGTYIYPLRGALSQCLANWFPRIAEKIIMISKKVRSPNKAPDVIWHSKWFMEPPQYCRYSKA